MRRGGLVKAGLRGNAEEMRTWVPVPEGSGFGVNNLPYGVFSQRGELPRVGVAIGEQVLDLAELAASGLLADRRWFAAGSLNSFMAAGRPVWQPTRDRIMTLLTDISYRDEVEPALYPMSDVELHMPFTVADYVDFYSSRDHATNLGRILRPGDEPLLPNWTRLPVGYHGRAGDGGAVGHPGRTAQGAAQGRAGAGVRADGEARRRGRGRLRDRGTVGARPAGADGRVPRPCVRFRAGQRLERARHPGLGVPAAGPVPGQVVRDVRLAVGGPGRRAGGGPRPPAGCRTPSRCRTCAATSRGAWTSPWRSK